MDEFCNGCDSRMNKKGKMFSGNSVYQMFACPNCGVEGMKAEGLSKHSF